MAKKMSLGNLSPKRFMDRMIEKQLRSLTSVGFSRGSWLGTIIGDHYPGAWQCNDELKCEDLLAHPAVYACVTLISSDIGKMEFQLKKKNSDRIWQMTSDPTIQNVLKSPNRYQNENEFRVSWILSKIIHGVAYVLIDRDNRGNVRSLHVLDPARVKPGVADDGSLWYNLSLDTLTGITEANLQVPASDIIDDPYAPLHHVKFGLGLGPLYACAASAGNSLKIVHNSSKFFENSSRPGGILTAPGNISEATVAELKATFQSFRGQNSGNIAIVGDGLKFEGISYSASDSQLVEQLNLSIEMVAMVFRVPMYKLRQTTAPTSSEVMNRDYFDSCLGHLVESMGKKLDEAFGIYGTDTGIELDSSFLFRLDSSARNARNKEAISGGWMTVNEVRALEDLPPVAGGDTVYMQQQNYSLEALDKRDSRPDPFSSDGGIVPEASTTTADTSGDAPVVVAETVQESAMNGAQVASLLTIAEKVALGELPAATAAGMLAVSFPSLSQDQINAILDPMIGFTPSSVTTPEVEPVVDPPDADVVEDPQVNSDDVEEEENLEEIKSMISDMLGLNETAKEDKQDEA